MRLGMRAISDACERTGKHGVATARPSPNLKIEWAFLLHKDASGNREISFR